MEINKPSSDKLRPLIDHIQELRRRIIISLVWFVLFSAGSYFIVDSVLTWLAQPVGEFIFTAPTEAFLVHIKMTFGMGIVFSFPIFIYHAWKYVEVALFPHEKSLVFFLIPFSCVLFVGGVLLALFVVVPMAAHFLLQFGSQTLRPMISVQSYLSFLFWMIVGFGILFQLPLVVIVLCRMGILTTQQLGTYRKHVVVGLVILSAVITPGGDVASQLILAVLSYLLFELSVVIARQFEKSK